MSRRERVRAATRDEIKQIAREQMAEHGAAALSLNAIARAMELVPSALYRYFPDRSALIGTLILDALHDLAAAVRAAATDSSAQHGDQLLAATLAYRHWALAHPIDFQLVFGAPIPGTAAPDQATELAIFGVFSTYLDIMQAAWQAGELRVNPHFLPGTVADAPPDTPFGRYSPETMHAGIAGWSRMHGIVMLELFGQIAYTIANPERFYEDEMRAGIASWGLTVSEG